MFPSYKLLALCVLSIAGIELLDGALLAISFILCITICLVLYVQKKCSFKVLFEHLILYIVITFIILHAQRSNENALEPYINKDVIALVQIERILSESSLYMKYEAQLLDIYLTDSFQKKATCILMVNKELFENLFLPGDRIYAKINISELSSPKHSHQINTSKSYNRRGIFTLAWLKDYQSNGVSNSLIHRLYALKSIIKKKLYNTSISPVSKQFISALVLGDKKSVDSKVISSFRSLGLVHSLALSGMHISLVYGICVFLLNFFLKNRPKIKAFILISLILLYATITGLSPSVLRASLMFVIYAFSLIVNRPTKPLNIVCVSAVALLMYNPNYLFNVGFQLSYLAVFGILYFYNHFKELIHNQHVIFRFIFSLCIVSVAAQLSTAGISIYNFKEFPVSFLWANVLVLPLISFLLYLGVFYLTWILLLDEMVWLNRCVDQLFQILIDWVSLIKAYAFDPIELTLDSGQVVLYYCILVAVCFIFIEKSFKFFKWLYVFLLFAFISVIVKRNIVLDELLIVGDKKGTVISLSSNSKQVIIIDGSINLKYALGHYTLENRLYTVDTLSFRDKYQNNFMELNHKILSYGNRRILVLSDEFVDVSKLGSFEIVLLRAYRADLSQFSFDTLIIDSRISLHKRRSILESVDHREITIIDLSKNSYQTSLQ